MKDTVLNEGRKRFYTLSEFGLCRQHIDSFDFKESSDFAANSAGSFEARTNKIDTVH